MVDNLYIDLAICFPLSTAACIWLSSRRGLLKDRWKEVIAVSVACGFIGFILYLLLRVLLLTIGLPPTSWLTVPATVLMVWVYYEVLLPRHTQVNQRGDA